MKGRDLAAIGCGVAAGLLLGAVLALVAVNVWDHERADGPRVTVDRSAAVPGGPEGEPVPGSRFVRVDVSGDSETVVSIRTRDLEPAQRVALLLLLIWFLVVLLIGLLLLLWSGFTLARGLR